MSWESWDKYNKQSHTFSYSHLIYLPQFKHLYPFPPFMYFKWCIWNGAGVFIVLCFGPPIQTKLCKKMPCILFVFLEACKDIWSFLTCFLLFSCVWSPAAHQPLWAELEILLSSVRYGHLRHCLRGGAPSHQKTLLGNLWLPFSEGTTRNHVVQTVLFVLLWEWVKCQEAKQYSPICLPAEQMLGGLLAFSFFCLPMFLFLLFFGNLKFFLTFVLLSWEKSSCLSEAVKYKLNEVLWAVQQKRNQSRWIIYQSVTSCYSVQTFSVFYI